MQDSSCKPPQNLGSGGAQSPQLQKQKNLTTKTKFSKRGSGIPQKNPKEMQDSSCNPSPPSATESLGSPFGFLEGDFQLGVEWVEGGQDELGDTVPMLEGEGLIAQVDQEDFQFSPVVAVDGTWGIEDGDAMMDGEAGAGAHLAFPAGGDGQTESGGDEQALMGI